MKIKYKPERKNMGIPLTDSYGHQIATGMLQDGNDIIVMFVDTVLNTLHIERVINRHRADMLESRNLAKIEESAWDGYAKFFKDNDCVPAGCHL